MRGKGEATFLGQPIKLLHIVFHQVCSHRRLNESVIDADRLHVLEQDVPKDLHRTSIRTQDFLQKLRTCSVTNK